METYTEPQSKKKKTKQYQRKQKRLSLLAKKRKMHILWYKIKSNIAKEKENVNPISKGKEKMAPSDKRMTNAYQANDCNMSTPINRFVQEDLCTDDELEDMPMNTSIDAQAHKDPCRHYLDNMDVLCPYCSALYWMDEKLTKSSMKRKIRLPLLITPPLPLQVLYDGNNDQLKSFRSYTKVYNTANAFTSLCATLDPRVLSGKGPTSVTIHGELRHRTRSLQPQPGQDASYAQLYIYDPYSSLEIRNRRNPNLRKDVLKTIQDSLLQVNAFVDKFRQTHAILHQIDSIGHNLPAHLHYNSTTDRHWYNLPTADEIAIVIPGDGTKSTAWCALFDI
ncbi:hypothetical protein HYC85_027935 [Camellia sinensis]|uniref:Helitron helicase-like domain-containing protein n=1 Tax=Camellia sinensis TaxID=4442 RepID=A0A7J7FXS5_CAMSI|nr:hypothetical protein HYC85_027935 [Camellia sinensis]